MTSGMSGEKANQDKKATKNPNHERWKVIEYWFRSANNGNDEHFRLTGLTTTSLKFILDEMEEI